MAIEGLLSGNAACASFTTHDLTTRRRLGNGALIHLKFVRSLDNTSLTLHH
jgi:hypothetical protein